MGRNGAPIKSSMNVKMIMLNSSACRPLRLLGVSIDLKIKSLYAKRKYICGFKNKIKFKLLNPAFSSLKIPEQKMQFLFFTTFAKLQQFQSKMWSF